MTYDLDQIVLYINTLQKNHVARELYLFLIKTIFLQVGMEKMLSELIKDLSNGINMICFVDVNQDLI